MTDSTESATPVKVPNPWNPLDREKSNSSVQIQIKLESQSEFVPWDTEESEFLDLVDFGDVAFLVEIVIDVCIYIYIATICCIVYEYTAPTCETEHNPRYKSWIQALDPKP